MKMILCNSRSEANAYALKQGWAMSEWRYLVDEKTYRGVAYHEIYELPSWQKRGDRHMRESFLKQHLEKFHGERIVVEDWEYEHKVYVPKARIANFREAGNAELQAAIRAQLVRIAELEAELESVRAELRDVQEVEAAEGDEAQSEFDAFFDAPAHGEPEPVEPELTLDGLLRMKKADLKHLARSRGIVVTSQRPERLAHQILEVSS